MRPKPRPKLQPGRALDYFEHNERRTAPHVTQLDIVEWDMPEAEPSIIVEESRNHFKVNSVRRAWERLIGKKP